MGVEPFCPEDPKTTNKKSLTIKAEELSLLTSKSAIGSLVKITLSFNCDTYSLSICSF